MELFGQKGHFLVSMSHSIVSIGEPIIDFVEAPASTATKRVYQTNAGGGAANVLAAAAAVGGAPAMIGRVGDDLFGEYLIDRLIARGVNPAGIKKDHYKQTGIGFVSHREQGEREFLFYRGTQDVVLYDPKKDRQILENAEVYHFTSVSMVTSALKRDTLLALDDARALRKVISFDVNDRPALWADRSEGEKVIRETLKKADIIKLSQEEMTFLFPGESLDSCAARLFRMGAKLACISLGEEGCYLAVPDFSLRQAAPKVQAVDTTGCGDAFMGALLQTLCTEGHIYGLERISPDALGRAAEYAVYAGSICATRQGSFECMPTLEEIRRRIANSAKVESGR